MGRTNKFNYCKEPADVGRADGNAFIYLEQWRSLRSPLLIRHTRAHSTETIGEIFFRRSIGGEKGKCPFYGLVHIVQVRPM